MLRYFRDDLEAASCLNFSFQYSCTEVLIWCFQTALDGGSHIKSCALGRLYLISVLHTLINQLFELRSFMASNCLSAILLYMVDPVMVIRNRVSWLSSILALIGRAPSNRYTASFAVFCGRCWICFKIFLWNESKLLSSVSERFRISMPYTL